MIGAACVATIAGFAAFALSPSPLVRSFGLLLVVGVALAFVVALTGGLAALGLSAWRGSPGAGRLARPPAVPRHRRPPPVDRRRRDRDGDRKAAPGARRRPAARRLRLGGERRDRGGDRHPRPRPAQPGGAQGPERAREGDRDLRRRQRDDQGPGPDQPGGDRLGRGLPAARARAPRLLGLQSELRRRPDLPGSLADGLLRRSELGLVDSSSATDRPGRRRRPRPGPGAPLLHLADRDQPPRRVQSRRPAPRRSATRPTSPSASGCSRCPTSRS